MEKDTDEIIAELKESLQDFKDKVEGMIGDLTIIEDHIKELESENSSLDSDNDQLEDEKRELENELDALKESKGKPLDTLKEIIDKAEGWDYGLKGWRTLETKQDLIDAIKKEVL